MYYGFLLAQLKDRAEETANLFNGAFAKALHVCDSPRITAGCSVSARHFYRGIKRFVVRIPFNAARCISQRRNYKLNALQNKCEYFRLSEEL